MRVFVAYSRPRGMLGRFVFTIMAYYAHQTESIDIGVSRKDIKYSCSYCGKWASITTISTIEASEHRQMNMLELFRYDNVEPGDLITITLKDTDLLLFQVSKVRITHKSIHSTTSIRKVRANLALGQLPEKIYEVIVIDWDAYLNEILHNERELRVEEELIRQTMNAEQITIQELRLEPVSQLPAIQGQQQFIEGEFRHLTD